MAADKKKTTLDLVAACQKKIADINNGAVYSSDFECANLLQEMVDEVRLLAFEVKNLKKLEAYQKLYITKKEHEIEMLQHKNSDLVERLIRYEKS